MDREVKVHIPAGHSSRTLTIYTSPSLLSCVLFSLLTNTYKLQHANLLLMSLHRQRGSARSLFCESRARAMRPSGRSMNIWSSECFTSGFGPRFFLLPFLLHFLIKRGFAFWLSWPLSPSLTLLLSGKEPNCHFVLQVCGRPGSMAWAVRTLHQRTRVITIDLLSVGGLFGSHFSIWKRGLFHCSFTLVIELFKPLMKFSGIVPTWLILSANTGLCLNDFALLTLFIWASRVLGIRGKDSPSGRPSEGILQWMSILRGCGTARGEIQSQWPQRPALSSGSVCHLE